MREGAQRCMGGHVEPDPSVLNVVAAAPATAAQAPPPGKSDLASPFVRNANRTSV